jgi:pimeloyl-ACP methyl ester carboxylesterase
VGCGAARGIDPAGIPMCSVSAGAPQQFDWTLGIGLAYDVTLGWPEAWGAVGDVRDDLTWEEVEPIVFGQVWDPDNAGKLEFIRLVNDMPAEDFYSLMPPGFWMVMQMITVNRASIESHAGGPVAQNLDHVYALNEDEIAYLDGMGVDAEALLAEMNARTNIEARRSARQYMEHYADLNGDIKKPVLSMHAMADSLCPVAGESVYRKTVAAAGREDMLVQVYTNGAGHCAFTPEQMLAAFAAMDHWLDTGAPPDPADATLFPTSAGFLPAFEPPPWPHPIH